MLVRRLVALLLAAWTAALPAHVPVVICLCSHGADRPCRHAGGECACTRGNPVCGIDARGAAPEACRCFTLRSSQDLARVGASHAPEAREAVAEPPPAPGKVEAIARLVPPEIGRAVGPPIFLRVRALLV